MSQLRLVALAVCLTACQSQFPVLEPTARSAAAPPVVVVSEGGRLPTKPVVRTPSATPTTDIVLRINTVIAVPTRTPLPPGTPVPTLAFPSTSTPRPTPTRFSGAAPRVPTATHTPRPTRTPRPTIDPLDADDTRLAVLSPTAEPPEPDMFEPNETAAEAVALLPGDVFEELNVFATEDVDTFAVPVDEPDTTLVVSISGLTLVRYKLDIVAPNRGTVGRQRMDGTVALRSIADVGADVGTYYVVVRRIGALPPEGPYSISASVLAPASSPIASP